MRLRQRCRLGNDDMSMNVDCRRRRPSSETFGIVNPRGAKSTPILSVDH
jgi:hypothetical protein